MSEGIFNGNNLGKWGWGVLVVLSRQRPGMLLNNEVSPHDNYPTSNVTKCQHRETLG